MYLKPNRSRGNFYYELGGGAVVQPLKASHCSMARQMELQSLKVIIRKTFDAIAGDVLLLFTTCRLMIGVVRNMAALYLQSGRSK